MIVIIVVIIAVAIAKKGFVGIGRSLNDSQPRWLSSSWCTKLS